jgi:hypothetical protein
VGTVPDERLYHKGLWGSLRWVITTGDYLRGGVQTSEYVN